MVTRRGKRGQKLPLNKKVSPVHEASPDSEGPGKGPTTKVKCSQSLDHDHETFSNPEVERQIAAIRAITDVESDQLVNALCLLRSNFSKEHIQTPLLQFFNENLPNLQILDNDIVKINEPKWKDDSKSLLHRMSTAYPHPSFSGFDYTNKAGKQSSVDAKNLHIREFALEEQSSQIPGLQDGLQTPGGEFNSQRMSHIGMTPKTLRQPKKGEMLLSVHGSPLGVYNEEQSLEAIHESEEG